MGTVSIEQVRGTYKARDSWWTVLLVDPVASRLVLATVGHRWLTPTRLTVVAFLLGLAAAAAFLTARPWWLVMGAALYYVAFVVDCVDGKIARLRDERSVRGSWLDFLLDRVRVMVCTVALFSGQFLATGSEVYLFAAIAVVFLTLNGAETNEARRTMAARRGGHQVAPPAVRLPGPAVRLQAGMHRRRIRMNLVSAIELEMALFVVAPPVAAAAGGGAILAIGAVAAALLILFELALMARFWRVAGGFDRWSRAAGTVPAPRPDQAPAPEADPAPGPATEPATDPAPAAPAVRGRSPSATAT